MTNVRNAPQRINRAVTAAVEYQAGRSENYMRRNAKWMDRTSNARNGLHARTSHTDTEHIITLAHSVPYGIWLEVRWSGKYGIIPEAVRVGGDELMRLFTKLFSGLS
jgi:hypothetical protein